ncbi:MAG: LON peptidase substrate-binding domain-containing protein [Burkholderiaceae bacterium]|nr:LON peptidase substrate-binding domain-containing protein [Burkholderiaceae bacterium]
MVRDLAIFPLGTVLFPGGVLPLRVFEARYLDLVRECAAADAPFGVCLITEGSEVGEAAQHEAVGCTAHIVDFGMEDAGVLNLRTVGGQRFRVLERRVRKDRLVRADVEMIDPDDPAPVSEEYAACASLLRRLVDDLVAREPDPMRQMIARPYDFDSAAWVGNRLCEFLPIPPRARQKLMELDDALTRLSLIQQYLKQHRVI